MIINNTPIPGKALKFCGLIQYLESMKFQAYHIDTKKEAEAKKPEFDRLLAQATALGRELGKEYPIYPDDVANDTYKLIYGVDKPKKESKEDWYKRIIAEDGDIY